MSETMKGVPNASTTRDATTSTCSFLSETSQRITNSSPEIRSHRRRGRSKSSLEAFAHSYQEIISDLMTEGVVDCFEVVETTKRTATTFLRPAAANDAWPDSLKEQNAIGRRVRASWSERSWERSEESCSSALPWALTKYAAVTSARVWAASLTSCEVTRSVAMQVSAPRQLSPCLRGKVNTALRPISSALSLNVANRNSA